MYIKYIHFMFNDVDEFLVVLCSICLSNILSGAVHSSKKYTQVFRLLSYEIYLVSNGLVADTLQTCEDGILLRLLE